MHLIDVDKLKQVVVSGLKEYLGCEVIRTNQNAEPPAYPYVSYTITTLASANNGTYEEYTDGTTRKQLKQTWSITAQSNKESESVNLAIKAREWLDYAGRVYLKDNGVTVQSVTNVTNRDNILTVEYEYKNGFDVVFFVSDETENNINKSGTIDKTTLTYNGKSTTIVDETQTIEDLKRKVAEQAITILNLEQSITNAEKRIDDSKVLD